MEIRTPEIAAVDEEKLVPKGLFRPFRAADETFYAGEGRIRRNVHNISNHSCSEKVHNPELQGLGRFKDGNFLTVVKEGERDIGTGQCDPAELFIDMAEFDVVGFQELPPCGDIVKEIPDGKIGALRGRDLPR